MNTFSSVSMNRPVTAHDIAAKLGKSIASVRFYLSKEGKAMNSPSSILINNTAKEMGYDPKASKSYAAKMKDGTKTNSWYGGNFKSRQEEIARMQELRAKGYSNAEIAKAVGRTYESVRKNIGKQDPELTKQNVAMAAHIRAQKNAARKQYVINKPIREYNKKVEQHNKMKAELNMLQLELLEQKPAIEQTAQTKIDFPMVDLHTVQPKALQ